ncbi:MAG: Flp pilus assembly complex ATPase component TadA [Kiritimatiellae bacterium]|nr:Flp pilus assembly complex ATPase component TadA [Kiritimatiellia bacterium]
MKITFANTGKEDRVVEVSSTGEISIGRVDDNDIVLPNKKVSRFHAALSNEGGKVFVSDKDSTFGTLLNGNKINGSSVLSPGDRLEIGGNVLEFSLDNPAAQSSPPPAGAVPVMAEGAAVEVDTEFSAMAVLYTDDMMALKKRIHEQVLFKLNLAEIATQQIQDEEMKAKLELALDEILREIRHELSGDLDLGMFRQALLDELIGYGPITPMLRAPSVDEVMVNGPGRIFVERKGQLYETDARFFDERHLITIIHRIVEPLGRHVDEASPMVDARLPDGSRVNAVIPPLALDGASLTIRKFATTKLTTEDLINFGSMTSEIAAILQEAVRARQNVLVSGGTGSGKTTLLNVLSQFINNGERVVTIEDSAELKLTHRNIVRMEARPPNIEGHGRVTIRDLVINALRMRPDRIIVGECRGSEALDMLQAMNTGHDGSLTTVHANTPRDALARLENMVMMAGFDLPSSAIRDQISSAIDIIVQQNRMLDGSRKIVRISEVTGREGDVILMQDIFIYEQDGFTEDGKVKGHYVATGNIPSFVDELKAKGDLKVDMGVFVPRE